jgi:uncharacterized protein (DUF2236 family)
MRTTTEEGAGRSRVELRTDAPDGGPALKPGGRPVAAGPHDWGLFGPASVTWKVHQSPVLLVGGLRALICQSLHPLAMAGVGQHSRYKSQPLSRLKRTAEYVATVVFGDTDSAERAALGIRKVHEKVRGVDPVTGRSYYANDPELLLWVHCVEVHSFLASYRAYGGRLSPEEQDAYLAEQVSAGEIIGIERDRVPASRAEYREYFDSVRGELCCSEHSRDAINLVVSPPLVREMLPYHVPLRVLGAAAVAITPRHMRHLAGIERSLPTYALAGGVARASGVVMKASFFKRSAGGLVGKRTVNLPTQALEAAEEWGRGVTGSLGPDAGSRPADLLPRP